MPYTQEHKQATHGRIVEAARALFNCRGFEKVSIEEVMKKAGLSRGGFYNHFSSKEALFIEAVQSFGRTNPADRWEGVSFDRKAEGAELARQLINAYLSRAHLEDVEGQCPLVALPSDVSRATAGVKRAYRGLFEGMARVLGASFKSKQTAREKGLAISALCVGALVLARGFDDEEFANELREAARLLALKNMYE